MIPADPCGEVRFDVLRSALYHAARRRELDWTNRVFNVVVIILGAATAADILKAIGWTAGTVATGFATALVGGLQLCWDYAGRARVHEVLQRRCYELLSEIEACDNPTEKRARGFRSLHMKLCADEPPINPVVNATAFNTAVNALGFDRGETLYVPFYLHLFKVFVSEGHHFEKQSERELRLETARKAKRERRAKIANWVLAKLGFDKA